MWEAVIILSTEMLQAALGERPAPLVLKNARVLNVFTCQLLHADIAIWDEDIIGVGSYTGLREIDLAGKTVVPGFIDAHMHVESTMLPPSLLEKELLPLGTTTIIADPHEIANVGGLDGLEYFLNIADKMALHLYIMLPSCVPATAFETSGAVLDAEALLRLRGRSHVLGLGELMDVQGAIHAAPAVWAKLNAFEDMLVDGHAPMASGSLLQAYRLAGPVTDHESASWDEALEKLQAGFYVLIREGSAARNLQAILSGALKADMGFDRMAFCTDDKHLDDIHRDGHISHNIRSAIKLGVPPAQAYRMATLNPARIYGLRKTGAVAAGYRADLVVLEDYEKVTIQRVFVSGKPVDEAISDTLAIKQPCPPALLHSVHLPPLGKESLRLAVAGPTTPVIELIPRQINTRRRDMAVPCAGGFFTPNTSLQKIAVIERHHASGRIGVGILTGLFLHGAIASTVAHDSHNLIVAGDSDSDMLLAAGQLSRCAGGYAVVQEGKVLGVLPLPIGGLMTDGDARMLQKTLSQLLAQAHQMGVPADIDPFMVLSFLALPVLPEIRITDKGLFDSVHFNWITS